MIQPAVFLLRPSNWNWCRSIPTNILEQKCYSIYKEMKYRKEVCYG